MLQPAAAVMIVSPNGQFLIGHRCYDKYSLKGQWCLPGGAQDYGETIVEAAIREVHEECGLTLSAEGLTLLSIDDLVLQKYKRHYMAVNFLYRYEEVQPPEVKEPDKIDVWKWVHLPEAKEMPLTKATKQVLYSYENRCLSSNYPKMQSYVSYLCI